MQEEAVQKNALKSKLKKGTAAFVAVPHNLIHLHMYLYLLLFCLFFPTFHCHKQSDQCHNSSNDNCDTYTQSLILFLSFLSGIDITGRCILIIQIDLILWCLLIRILYCTILVCILSAVGICSIRSCRTVCICSGSVCSGSSIRTRTVCSIGSGSVSTGGTCGSCRGAVSAENLFHPEKQ